MRSISFRNLFNDGLSFFKSNLTFCILVTLGTFAISGATGAIPYVGFLISWIVGLYISTGWLLTYKKSRENTPPSFEVFTDSCKEANPILGNLIISQMYVHFLGMLMIMAIGGVVSYYLIFQGPQLINIISNTTSYDIDLLAQINTRITSYSHDFSKNDIIFAVILSVVSVVFLLFYSLLSQLLSAVVVNEKQSPLTNFQNTLRLISKGGWSLFFHYSLFLVLGVITMFATCFLGTLLVMPLMSILPQILYRDLKIPPAPTATTTIS